MADFETNVNFNVDDKSSGAGGEQGGSKYEKEMVKQNDQSAKQLKGILKATAAVAFIWIALAPVLNPLLKLLSLLILVTLIPLLPFIKDIAKKVGETIKAVREAQKTGSKPGSQAAAGLGALFGDWAGIGALIAAGFLFSLGGGASIAGLLFAGLSFALAWDTFMGADSDSLEEILKGSLGTGLAVAVTALAFGAGVYALPIGLLTFGVVAGLSFLKSAWNEDDMKTALKEAAAGSAILGVVAGGIALLLGAGLGTAAVVTVGIGTLLFAIFTGLKFLKKKDAGKELEEGLGSLLLTQEEIKNTQASLDNLNITKISEDVYSVGNLIGDPANESSLVANLNKSSIEWTKMKDTSVNATNQIITNLSLIPKEITTVHRIITVRSRR